MKDIDRIYGGLGVEIIPGEAGLRLQRFKKFGDPQIFQLATRGPTGF